MKLSSQTITKILNQCNGILNKQSITLRKVGGSNDCDLIAIISDKVSYKMYIHTETGRVIVSDINDKNIAWFEADSSTEIVQFITVILAVYMQLGTFELRILQSKSGWTSLKLVMLNKSKLCSIHTNVLKNAMLFNLVTVSNAKLGNAGNIVTNRNSTPKTQVVLNPNYEWHAMDWYIEALEKEGYL